MPFCPSCRFEYVADVKQCPDCGAGLVESLPVGKATAAPESYSEAELCTVVGEIHARLLQDMLVSQGIPSRFQPSSPFDSVYDVLCPPSVLGGQYHAVMRVVVRDSDLERARVIYADFEGKTAEGQAAEPRRRRKRTV